MPRKRAIEVLTLAQRIAAELASGRVDDVEMSDEQVEQVAVLLCPAPAAEEPRAARNTTRFVRRTIRTAAPNSLAPAPISATSGLAS